MTSTEFAPRVSLFGEMLIQLEDSPHVRLVVLLVFRIHRIQLASGTRRREERAGEECGETSEGAFEGRCPNAEVVIGVGCGGICIRCSVVLGEKLEWMLRARAREAWKGYGPQNIRSPEGTSPFPTLISAMCHLIHEINIP